MLVNEYLQYCAQLKTLANAAAEARRKRRALEQGKKDTRESFDRRWSKYLEPYEQALAAEVESLQPAIDLAFKAERNLVPKIEGVAALLMQVMLELRLQGHEVPDPPAPDRASYLSDFDVEIVDYGLVPAKYQIVDTKSIASDSKDGLVPGTRKNLTVTLRVEMSDSDFKRLGA